jgi:Domain of unknown function (DUF4386)
LLALLFIIVSTTIEAVNLFTYISPLFLFTLPEYNTLDLAAQKTVTSVPIKLFGYAFSVSLTFFGVFCALVGALIVRSKFLPTILGMLMIVAGVTYWINSFRLFLALPIPYLPWVTLVAELSLALWLLVVGLNETKWLEKAGAKTPD